MAVAPSGKFAYVVNRLDNTVSLFTINAGNGTLTLVATVATGSEPFRMAIDSSGHFAYVANENGASVSIYTLTGDGTLTPAGAAATQGEALSVVLSGTNWETDNQTQAIRPVSQTESRPNLTRWRKLLHLCCTSPWQIFSSFRSLCDHTTFRFRIRHCPNP